MFRALAPLMLSFLLIVPAAAQRTMPQPVRFHDTIPAPRDKPYPGTIRLEVDARDVEHGVFRVHERIPVDRHGPMVLLYPEWLPGKHSNRGEIEKLAGLVIRAGGKIIPWLRDPVDVYAFHIDVPRGVTEIEAGFQFVSATASNQGRVVMTPAMLNLQWPSVSLYPAGYFVRRIPVEARAIYPAGWTAASALRAKAEGDVWTYETTDYDTLVDSPVFAGAHFRSFALSPKVTLDVVADSEEELAAPDEAIAAHKALVDQAVKLWGAEHYDHYDILLAISNELGGIGLEHHRSSENQVDRGYFTDWANALGDRDLIPHEYDHSWMGKFRRGADSWTPDFRTPMRNSLLWVYEGQDQFWGYVLAARSGMLSKQQALDAIASIAAAIDSRPGREWRSVLDTTNDPIITPRKPKGWVSWQRSEDYYNEGLLVWLEADAVLRAKSGGTRSMDDFARAFAGFGDGDWGDDTYTFDDVVRTLEGVQPGDWRGFLTDRILQVNPKPPLGGITGNGWRLVFTDTPTPYFRAIEKSSGQTNLRYAIGLVAGRTGNLIDVQWNGLAARAGITLADDIVAVNGMSFSGDRLKAAVTAAKDGTPILLSLRRGDRYRDVAIDYRDGLRYPRLEKTGEGETGLDRLLAPR